MNNQEFVEVLCKFRGEPASILEFKPSIDALINSADCLDLGQVLHPSETKWERLIAVENLGSMLPAERGLYMFVWRPDLTLQFSAVPETERFFWVLYVGKAGKEGGLADTIKNRYTTEYSKYVGKDPSCLWDSHAASKREDRLARYLTLRPLEFWYLTMTEVPDIQLLERRLIKILQPPLNIQHSRKLQAGIPTPAF